MINYSISIMVIAFFPGMPKNLSNMGRSSEAAVYLVTQRNVLREDNINIESQKENYAILFYFSQ